MQQLFMVVLFFQNPKSKSDDIQEAVDFVKKSTDDGNPLGMTYYAYVLSHGITVPVNKSGAISYYKKAIEKGCPQAMDGYTTLLNEEGDRNSKKEALKFYKMAVDKDYPLSIYKYAMMLYNGDGIEQNKNEAVRFLEKAVSTDAM